MHDRKKTKGETYYSFVIFEIHLLIFTFQTELIQVEIQVDSSRINGSKMKQRF